MKTDDLPTRDLDETSLGPAATVAGDTLALYAYERLAKAMAETPEHHVKKAANLPLASIHTAPALFQAREGTAAEGAVNEGHVLELARALRAKRADARWLDPVTVFAVGAEVYCIDGHHRLAAYRAIGATVVPVTWFEGALEDAVSAAIEQNQKAKLSMTAAERMEGAWTLTILGTHSKAQIASKAGVAERTVANMRSVLRQYRQRFPRRPPGRYHEVREALGSQERPDFSDEMKEAMIERFRATIGKQFGKEAAKHPTMFAEALFRYGGQSFAKSLADYWGFLKEEEEHDFGDGDENPDF